MSMETLGNLYEGSGDSGSQPGFISMLLPAFVTPGVIDGSFTITVNHGLNSHAFVGSLLVVEDVPEAYNGGLFLPFDEAIQVIDENSITVTGWYNFPENTVLLTLITAAPDAIPETPTLDQIVDAVDNSHTRAVLGNMGGITNIEWVEDYVYSAIEEKSFSTLYLVHGDTHGVFVGDQQLA